MMYKIRLSKSAYKEFICLGGRFQTPDSERIPKSRLQRASEHSTIRCIASCPSTTFRSKFENSVWKASLETDPLDQKTKRKISKVIDTLTDFSFQNKPHIKKLKTPFEGYRIRAGDYRILFVVDTCFITLYSIKHRKDAYK